MEEPLCIISHFSPLLNFLVQATHLCQYNSLWRSPWFHLVHLPQLLILRIHSPHSSQKALPCIKPHNGFLLHLGTPYPGLQNFKWLSPSQWSHSVLHFPLPTTLQPHWPPTCSSNTPKAQTASCHPVLSTWNAHPPALSMTGSFFTCKSQLKDHLLTDSASGHTQSASSVTLDHNTF